MPANSPNAAKLRRNGKRARAVSQDSANFGRGVLPKKAPKVPKK